MDDNQTDQAAMTMVEKQMAAAMAGSKFFDPGKPCPKGHEAMRYVRNGACVECARQKSRDYNRRIRQAIRDASDAAIASGRE